MTDNGDGWADLIARADAQRDEAQDRAARYLALLELEVAQVVRLRDDLSRLRDLLRADVPARPPQYALACRDIAHALDALLEKP